MNIDDLKAFGANVDDGLQRCMNNEDFYLRLVNKALASEVFDELKSEFEKGNIKEAFGKAHDLKGMLGNLSLTPLYVPMSELTELLRSGEPVADDNGLIAEIFKQLDIIKSFD